MRTYKIADAKGNGSEKFNLRNMDTITDWTDEDYEGIVSLEVGGKYKVSDPEDDWYVTRLEDE